jgi:aryl-alcohol dehydrogenase-like predicted oxidoreductase
MYARFREAGGNFVDTANNYTDGNSEEIVGHLVASDRDAVVVSTKYTLATTADANSGGSHRKSLRTSVETSLRRLRTDYIDLLFVHAWDQKTPVEETMRALDDLVGAGKVLAIGVSNMPAWVVGRADLFAELRGWSRFCAMQVPYSLADRTPDRDLIPMAEALGIAVSAWSPLARGLLAGKPRPEGSPPPAPGVQAVIEEAASVASQLGTSPAQVALAWVMAHGCTPVLGATSVAQITDNLAAADLILEDEQVKRLNELSAVPMGYPVQFLRDLFPDLAVDP